MPSAEATAAKPDDAPMWRAGEIVYRKLSELKAYPNNPRTHSAEQIATLASMIGEFGFTQPLLIDEENMILAGHGRTMAAQNIGLEEVPVIVRAGLTEAQKRAIVIADNQVALSAGWDEVLLKAEIGELKRLDFDLKLLGFPDLQIVEFVSGLGDGVQAGAGESDGPQERDLDEAEEASWVEAWRILAKDWIGIFAKREAIGFVSTSYTKGALAVYFLRARFFGHSIPSAATTAYTGHRVATNGDKRGSIADLLTLAAKEDATVKSIQFISQGKPKLDVFISTSLGAQGHRLAGEFPADLARALYDEFVTEPGGSVLDPCHGWGGRMLGFLLSKNATHYDGFDTDPKTFRGVQEMFTALEGFAATEKTSKLVCAPFETAKLKAGVYDFALTSPPYFNVEKYGGDESSWRKYSDFDKWVAGFYAPMIKSVARALKPGASFALQIGNQSHPLEATAKSIADTCGLIFAETRHTSMINNYNKTEKDDGEVIVIFRKKNPA